MRDSKPGDERSYSTLLNSSVGQVSYILGSAFERRDWWFERVRECWQHL